MRWPQGQIGNRESAPGQRCIHHQSHTGTEAMVNATFGQGETFEYNKQNTYSIYCLILPFDFGGWQGHFMCTPGGLQMDD